MKFNILVLTQGTVKPVSQAVGQCSLCLKFGLKSKYCCFIKIKNFFKWKEKKDIRKKVKKISFKYAHSFNYGSSVLMYVKLRKGERPFGEESCDVSFLTLSISCTCAILHMEGERLWFQIDLLQL